VLGIILAVSVLAAAPAAMAQAEKAVRIGVLRAAPDDAVFRRNSEPFWQALRQRGFLEGRNLRIEWRVRPGSAEEIGALAVELVRLNVDAILAIAPAGVRAARRATKSIPIVAVDLETDPKAAGFAASLARPGGNITGLFLDFPDLGGKWVELVKEVVPNVARLAVLWDPATGSSFLKGVEAAARALKLEFLLLEAHGPGDFAALFKSLTSKRAEAILVLGSPVFNSARKQIAELAAKHRMPAIMPFGGFAEDGGLIAYGPHLEAMFEQAGGVMAKVLQGTRPGEIPIERPTRFELVVNLRTAKALGVTIPTSILVRADRAIE
jgi:putative ABC transport system substrate-binding protein